MSQIGSFQVVRELGAGRLGKVCEAVHPVLGSRVAIKMLGTQREDALAQQAFVDFVAGMKRLADVQTHPHLVTIIEAETSGAAFLAMELLRGETLTERLSRGALGVWEAVQLARQITQALAFGHTHLGCHGALHPGNVMLDGSSCKVLDFGQGQALTQLYRNRGQTVTEVLFPSNPAYMAPEQYFGSEQVQPSLDLYSLGVILFESLTGHRPFEGSGVDVLSRHLRKAPISIARLRPELPRQLCELVHGLLAKAPALRPTSAQLLSTLSDLMRQIDQTASEKNTAVPHSEAKTLRLGHYELTGRLSSEGALTSFAIAAQPDKPAQLLMVLSHEAAADVHLAQRFLLAAQAGTDSHSPFLQHVSDHGHLPDGRPYAVVDAVEGYALSDRLQTALPLAEGLYVLSSLAEALSGLHANGAVHLCLCPDRVVLVPDLSRPFACRPVLLWGDTFRRAERRDAQTWPLTGVIIESPSARKYLAPEQLLGQPVLDGKTDVYALATLAYRLVGGVLPLESGSADRHRELHLHAQPAPLPATVGAPSSLQEWMNRAFAKNPAARPSMSESARILGRLANTCTHEKDAPKGAVISAKGTIPLTASERPVRESPVEESKTSEHRSRTEKLPPPPAAQPTDRFGKLRVVRHIGTGSMTDVYAVEHIETGQRAVVKALLPSLANDRAMVDRFLRQARALSRTRHAGVVGILDYNQQSDGTPYLVVEHADGEPLRTILNRVGALPPEQALTLAKQLSDTLAAAHAAGVIHRGVHPGNVLVQWDAGGITARLLDFGMAQIRSEHASIGGATGTQTALTELAYVAPELLVPRAQYDERVDVYSLGAVIVELLGGRPPMTAQEIIARSSGAWSAEYSVQLPPQVPRGFAALLTAMLATNPAQRPMMMQVSQQLAASLRPRPRSLLWPVSATLLVVATLGASYYGYEQTRTVRFEISSEPPGAEVCTISEDRKPCLGKTPLTVELPVRGSQKAVRLQLRGYQEESLQLDPRASEAQRREHVLLQASRATNRHNATLPTATTSKQ